MAEPTRRELLAASMAAFLAPVRSLAAAVKPVRITEVEIFSIRLPASKTEIGAGVNATYPVARIATDAGVTGYSFAYYMPKQDAVPAIRQALVGKDLFAVEQHLKTGVRFLGLEHAIWDAIGRIAKQPVYRLLGAKATSVKPYLTCVWQGNPDQSQVPFKDQAEMAVKIKKAGFKGMKIRVWRPNFMDDVQACREIKAAVGPDFAVMFDRTAEYVSAAGQKTWDYDTGLKAARGLQEAGAYWLEEPYARADYKSPARLAAEVDIPITGGEGFYGIEPFRECLLNRTYDIVQPEGGGSGGILTCRKVGIMAEAFHVPCILHGTMGMSLAGWLQASLAIGCEWEEVAIVTPPMLPDEQWAPALKVIKSPRLFDIRDGILHAPEFPGLGLDIDEEALRKYRV